MTDRIKVGDKFLELPKGMLKAPVVTVAEKSEIPDALEGPAYSSCRSDAIQELITGAAKAPALDASEPAPVKAPDFMEEWDAFCGPKSKLPEHWLSYRDKNAQTCGFNKFACLFGVQWFLYHKMYVNGLISLIVEVAPIIAIVLWVFPAGSAHSGLDDMEMAIVFGISLLVRIAIGYWANVALYRRAVSEIAKIHALHLAPEKHLLVIRSAGEGSVAPVILFNGLFTIAKIALQHS